MREHHAHIAAYGQSLALPNLADCGSLAECLDQAMRSQRPLDDWFAAERAQGVGTVVETVHAVLSDDAVTMRDPSGLNCARQTAAPWPENVEINFPADASQRHAVWSEEAVTMRSPSGLNCAWLTAR